MSTTLYIAGPMSGLPDHNYPAFRDAASVPMMCQRTRDVGFAVFVLVYAHIPALAWEALDRDDQACEATG